MEQMGWVWFEADVQYFESYGWTNAKGNADFVGFSSNLFHFLDNR